MWAPIIAELMAMFGPLLQELLKAWIESLFKKTAAKMGSPEGYDGDAKESLIAEALAATPRVQIVRRNILRFMRDHANESKLTPAMKKEFKAIAAG